MALGLLIGFLVIIIVGLPVGFAMGVISIVSIGILDGSMLIIPQKLFSSINNFTYLCIPLYVLAAEIMSVGGLTEKIVHFCDCLVGHIHGGLSHVNVLGSMFFAGISGSATADVSGLGRLEIDMQEKAGYPRDYAASVTAASAIIGPIIPPSTIMVIYAVCASNVSVSDMFLGGIVPGVMLGLFEMIICYFQAKKNHYPRRAKRASASEIIKATKETLPCLMLPVIILGGIGSGVFTATEAGGIAVLYAVVVVLIMRSMNLRSFFNCCISAAKATGNVMFIIAVASAMGWTVTTLQIPQQIANFCMQYISTPTQFLLFVNFLLLIIGMILDQSPALLLMVPILLPVATEYGIDPLQFGLIVCINLTVGLITPPVGMTLFVTSNVSGVKLTTLYRRIIPFVLAGLLVLILITYIPVLTTGIPALLNG